MTETEQESMPVPSEYKLIHLWGERGCPDYSTFDPIIMRQAAVRLSRYACGGDYGMAMLGDRIFEEVTEGRQARAIKAKQFYSACGDLPHWLFDMLGCRDEWLVNKDNDGGDIPWRTGKNISRIVYAAQGAFRWARQNRMRFPKLGDVLYLAKPEHVGVLVGVVGSISGEAPSTVIMAEYGQIDDVKLPNNPGRAPTFKPCGKIKPHLVDRALNGDIKIGKRQLIGWYDLEMLPHHVPAKVPRSFELGVDIEDDDNPYIYPAEYGYGE